MFDKILNVIDAIGIVGPLAIGGMVLGVITMEEEKRKFAIIKLLICLAILGLLGFCIYTIMYELYHAVTGLILFANLLALG